MGGKIRIGTKTKFRLSKGKKLFKVVHGKKEKVKDTDVSFVSSYEEEGLFEFKNQNHTLFIMFDGNDITTYAVDKEFFEDTNKKGGI